MRERNPIWGLMPRRLILGITNFGPIGQLKAPGTWGSVVGILLFTVIFAPLAPVYYLLLSLFLIFVAVPFCEEAEIRLGRKDPGCVILDECVAIPVCFFSIPFQPGEPAWPWILGGFALFRFFDILKPLGIGKLQNLQGGWGVVADDIAAAVATNICLQIIYFFLQP